MSKLDWDMSAVIAFDFVEHIIQRVAVVCGVGFNVDVVCGVGFNVDVVRRHSETLITMCSAHHIFSCISPCLIAASSVLTTLRPFLESSGNVKTTEALSPCSSVDSATLPDMEEVLDVVENITTIAKVNSK